MLVKTESDGDFTLLEITDSGKKFSYELYIKNNQDGSCSITYMNSNNDEYELLNVLANGTITSEVPTLQ